MLDILIIGGGQAGLAAGYQAQRAGLSFAILEAGAKATGSWARYYDSLKLFSPARHSSLPGMRFPGRPDRYPTRDEVVGYLRAYAEKFKLPIHTNARVEQIERQGAAFVAVTSGGERYVARSIIAATGAFNRPYLPEFAGQTEYQGQVLHSSGYQKSEPFRGQRVLVIGAGNSAVQIATELAQVAEVTLTNREPVQFRKQVILGRDIHFWIRVTGFDTLVRRFPAWMPDEGSARQVLDSGKYATALASGNPRERRLFERFTLNGVQWADGEQEDFDTVLFATGFRPNLQYLADLGALDSHGNALHDQGVSTTVPNLYYVGISGQRSHASATLRGVGDDAAYVLSIHRLRQAPAPSRVTKVWRVLRGQPCCAPQPG